jgi:hypothetical protein
MEMMVTTSPSAFCQWISGVKSGNKAGVLELYRRLREAFRVAADNRLSCLADVVGEARFRTLDVTSREDMKGSAFAALRLITNLIGAWTGSARQIGLPVIGVLQLPCKLAVVAK